MRIRMMKLFFLFCLTGFVATHAWAEDDVEIKKKLKECSAKEDAASLNCYREVTQQADNTTRALIERNMEQSYVTLGPGIGFGADRTTHQMLYEGQVFKNISWYDKVKWNKHFWWDVPIRIGVRQLTVKSMPVRTPSFNPGLRLYWYEDGKSDTGEFAYPFIYYSVGAHHYSNGQEGPSTNADGSVNTENGSFNTNYMEGAVHWAWMDGAWVRAALRGHLYRTFEDFQKNQYEKWRLSAEVQSDKTEGGCFPGLSFLYATCQYQLKWTGIYKDGYRYLVKNDVNPAMNVEARFSDRLDTSLEVIIKPDKYAEDSRWKLLPWKEMSLYLRYDYGHDYYNINFQNRMNRLQIGLIGKTL